MRRCVRLCVRHRVTLAARADGRGIDADISNVHRDTAPYRAVVHAFSATGRCIDSNAAGVYTQGPRRVQVHAKSKAAMGVLEIHAELNWVQKRHTRALVALPALRAWFVGLARLGVEQMHPGHSPERTGWCGVHWRGAGEKTCTVCKWSMLAHNRP